MGTIIQKGIKYGSGNDGFSPVVTITDIENGHKVDVRDVNGVKSFEVLNGADGKDGLTEGILYTTLEELSLTSSATIQDVMDKLAVGEQCIIRTDAFSDLTQFNNLPYAYLYIAKTVNGMCKMELYDVTSKNFTYKGRQAGGKFQEWINYSNVYTTLTELGLTSDTSLDSVISALPYGSTAILDTSLFTNYKTIFPNDCTDDQYAIVEINKANSSARTTLRWTRKNGRAYAIGSLDASNKFAGWNKHTFIKDGYGDDSIIAIGDAVSGDGTVQTLESLGFSADIMTWDTGEYRVSHVANLINLPPDISSMSTPPGFALKHENLKKWNSNHNPASSTWAIRMSTIHTEKGNTYTRFTASGATAGTYTTDTGWRKVNTNDSATLVTNTSTLKLDVTKKHPYWIGTIKLNYTYSCSLSEVEISFNTSEATAAIEWTVSKGHKYIKNITYTQDTDNASHYTIGIEFHGTTYGNYQADVIGDFAVINSLTKDAFTGEKTAVYDNPYGKNNGVTLVTHPEDLGLTSTCTTVQLVQAMRNKFNITVNSGAIGVFNNGGKTITDAPSDYGLLHIEAFGHDRLLIRYEGISGSSYAGSWIGKITGSNGTFSGITWESIDNTFNGKTVKTVTIDLSASDLQITSGSVSSVKLGNYINASTRVIRVEGYYTPPENSGYYETPVYLTNSTMAHGGIVRGVDGFSFVVAGSTTGKKGSGYIKFYYVD